MRRSAKTLADRGQIECERVEPRLRREKNSLLYCWLPSHDAPRRYGPQVKGDPKEAVESAIQAFQSLSDEEWREEWDSHLKWPNDTVPDGKIRVSGGTVPYKYIVGKAIKKLGGSLHENPHATAVWRATRKLEEEGKIEIHRNKNGTAWAISVFS